NGHLTFTGGVAGAWTTGTFLRIKNWVTSNPSNPSASSATSPLYLGTSDASPSNSVFQQDLLQIHFTGYLTGAEQVFGTGEIVPNNSTQLRLGDVDDSGQANAGDILPMEQALANLTNYESPYNAMTNPWGNHYGTTLDVADLEDILDINQDGLITNADLQLFVYDLSHNIAPTYAVPEPSTLALGFLGAVGLVSLARKRRRPAA
ncbi:MAG TPA: PEP-CTERM sorting domain-containing protein, partial [Pirellulales bacterium]|nr:PEP-CTERM sorting domain-containing protein [Pirellulales bacterium]